MGLRQLVTLSWLALVGLAGAVEAQSKGPVVVFAPHPDDEAVGCAGVIARALAEGKQVRVVALTNGDGFPAAAAGLSGRPMDRLTPDDFLALSRRRQEQMRAALEAMGGGAENLILLGYPDSALEALYSNRSDTPIRQQFTEKTTLTESFGRTFIAQSTASRRLIPARRLSAICGNCSNSGSLANST